MPSEAEQARRRRADALAQRSRRPHLGRGGAANELQDR